MFTALQFSLVESCSYQLTKLLFAGPRYLEGWLSVDLRNPCQCISNHPDQLSLLPSMEQ